MTTAVIIELIEIRCGRSDCDLIFGMPEPFYNARRRDHQTWFCPRGHARYFADKSDLQLAREERDAAKRAADYARQATAEAREDLAAERRSHRTTKGHKTRLEKRAAAGMCSQCGRTFQNYARHMETKHAKRKATK